MSRLVLPARLLESLRENLLVHQEESCAVLFGRSVEISGNLARIVIRESVFPEECDYLQRDRIQARLKPEFVSKVAQRARRTGESIVFVHTHPFALNSFSSKDDEGEDALRQFLALRAPEARHAAMLLTPNVSIARELGTGRVLRVAGIGPEIAWGDRGEEAATSDRFDRQVRAFGSSGQHQLHSIRVGIVGLGGTGSIVLQQLAHLGVRDFVLIDPDTVEETNLNRLVGAVDGDLGNPKVSVAKRLANTISPSSMVEARKESILQSRVARSLAAVDFVFACTDSHGSRAVLNQVAYQYLVPMIDMGVSISANDGMVTHVTGRIQLLAAGIACLTCANTLNPEQVRRDMLTEFERQADPYLQGAQEPAPSVISLNSTVSSLAVTMFLNVALGTAGNARLINYNGVSGATRPAICNPHPSCIVCSHGGGLARSDEWPLAARRDPE